MKFATNGICVTAALLLVATSATAMPFCKTKKKTFAPPPAVVYLPVMQHPVNASLAHYPGYRPASRLPQQAPPPAVASPWRNPYATSWR